ncbi:MAG: metallophosphoesterase family protein [Gemmataceae bacterium]
MMPTLSNRNRALSAFIAIAATMALVLPAHAQKREGEKGGQKHIFAGPPPAHPFDIILARPTDQSVTVSVLSYKDATVRVSYGLVSGKLDRSSGPRTLKKGEPVEFVLSNLSPDTRYYYRLSIQDGSDKTERPDQERTFHTQRKPSQAFTFTVQSDSHLDQNTRPAVYERTLANALADKPDFHIDLGDTFMTDKYGKSFKDAFPQYMAQRYYFGRIAHSAPLFLVLGNHDGERVESDELSGDSMPAWSCTTRKKLFPNPYPDGFYTGNSTTKKPIGRLENYYAWEWGDALFIALDPFWTSPRSGRNRSDGNWSKSLGKDQYLWLKKTLETSHAKYKFVFIHHLVGGLDENARGGSEAAAFYEWGGKDANKRDQFKEKRPGWDMPIHQLLVKHKVSAVLHGHDHFFAKQELDGIIYLMVPQPGHPGFDRLKNTEEYGYFRGEFLPPSGHIRVKVSPEQATVDYVRTYLPQSESKDRKNGQVGNSFKILPSQQ